MGGKIVDAQLAEKVKALRDEGKTQEQIAVELRIVQSTVSVILRRAALAAVSPAQEGFRVEYIAARLIPGPGTVAGPGHAGVWRQVRALAPSD